jgi:hypothetical protein
LPANQWGIRVANSMDYEMTLSHLEIVRKHVAQGERHVTNQRAVVRELEEDGHDTSQASALLAQFEGLQSMHIAHMERLGSELINFAAETRQS